MNMERMRINDPYENIFSFENTIDRLPLIPTSWWIITGGPSSGKTSLINFLADLGFATIPEAARAFIDQQIAQGKSIKDFRGGWKEILFQGDLRKMKEGTEASLNPRALMFMDRGMFDNCTYEELAYRKLNDPTMPVRIELPLLRRYAGVFLLDQLPFEQDYARTETPAEAQQIHYVLKNPPKFEN